MDSRNHLSAVQMDNAYLSSMNSSSSISNVSGSVAATVNVVRGATDPSTTSSSSSSAAASSSSLSIIAPSTPVSFRRKRVRHPERWKRNNYTRKVLRDKGACSCTRKCFEKINSNDRETIKQHFATLSKTQQDQLLLQLINIEQKRNEDVENEENRDMKLQVLQVEKQGEDGDDHEDEEDDNEANASNHATDMDSLTANALRKRAPKLFNSKYFVMLPQSIKS